MQLLEPVLSSRWSVSSLSVPSLLSFFFLRLPFLFFPDFMCTCGHGWTLLVAGRFLTPLGKNLQGVTTCWLSGTTHHADVWKSEPPLTPDPALVNWSTLIYL